jgi:hypothetical protein
MVVGCIAKGYELAAGLGHGFLYLMFSLGIAITGCIAMVYVDIG